MSVTFQPLLRQRPTPAHRPLHFAATYRIALAGQNEQEIRQVFRTEGIQSPTAIKEGKKLIALEGTVLPEREATFDSVLKMLNLSADKRD